MKLNGLAIPGYALKDGKLVPKPKRQSVSERLWQRKSKRTKPVRGKRLEV